jgi:hypothetical protein
VHTPNAHTPPVVPKRAPLLGPRLTRGLAALTVLTLASPAGAADSITAGVAELDPATTITLGVYLPYSDDDDRDATVTLRYREQGAAAFVDALPLRRVRPEVVVGLPVASRGFAGSVLGLRPGTTYELELTVTDPEGGGGVQTLVGTTRAVPGDPATPNVVAVSDAAGLASALAAAAPGDVIELSDGLYEGTFSIDASGTEAAPIVIRGASTLGTVLDGQGAAGNLLEIYGSHVHLERMTLRNANRALRFQGDGATGNVARHLLVTDVTLGIGGREGQSDFYLCDNELEGPLSWPHVYTDDGGQFANVDGIMVFGTGHVVCHNRLVGFGDALKTGEDGMRGVDFFGNDVLSAYDNGIELDGSLRNVRAFDNRLVNQYAALSFQPIYGGPAYAVRNVVVNVAHEQLKLHSLGGVEETSGAVVLHNTFVSPARALTLNDHTTTHDPWLANNLFVGPDAPPDGRTVEWTGLLDGAVFDHNGWHPDGRFDFGDAGDWQSFAELSAAGVFEASGALVPPLFESGLVAPASYTVTVEASDADASLAAESLAVDSAAPLPNVGARFAGAGPDKGALERGCAPPHYGPRPEGEDESTAPSTAGPACDGGGGAGGAGGGATGGESAGAAGGAGGSGGAGGGGPSASGPGGSSASGCGCRLDGHAPEADDYTRLGLAALLTLGAGLVVARRRRTTPAGRRV